MQAQGNNLRISHKQAMLVCNELQGMSLARAEKFLQNMLDKKENIDGKFYDTTSHTILMLIKSAEANARQKNMDVEKLFIKRIKSDKAYKFVRPKSRFKFRGRKAKTSNITVVLGK